MIRKEKYWPIKIEKVKESIKPSGFIPSKLMYSTKEGIDAFEEAAMAGSNYWLSWDSENCISQNAKYLSKLLKDYVLVELGGLNGSALNEVFKSGDLSGYKYHYINIDLGKNTQTIMNKNFSKIDNVEYSLLSRNFDNINFIKKLSPKNKKAILFLGNTFGNYDSKHGNVWLKELYLAMNIGDIFILGFDKLVSAKEHLKCYQIPSNGHMTMVAAQKYGMPIGNLRPCTIFDNDGIHGGVYVIKDFIFKGKKYRKNDFIEVFISLKQSLKTAIQRVKEAGFRVKKIIKSDKKHIHHFILSK